MQPDLQTRFSICVTVQNFIQGNKTDSFSDRVFPSAQIITNEIWPSDYFEFCYTNFTTHLEELSLRSQKPSLLKTGTNWQDKEKRRSAETESVRNVTDTNTAKLSEGKITKRQKSLSFKTRNHSIIHILAIYHQASDDRCTLARERHWSKETIADLQQYANSTVHNYVRRYDWEWVELYFHSPVRQHGAALH